MLYPGASGTVQAALQSKVTMAASDAMSEWNPARDKMRDSNGRMPFGEVRNVPGALGASEFAKYFLVGRPVLAHRKNLVGRGIGNATIHKLKKRGFAQPRVFESAERQTGKRWSTRRLVLR